MDSVSDPKYDDDFKPDLCDAHLTFAMKKRNFRKLKRKINAAINRTRRKRRTYFRQKEKGRRAVLKITGKSRSEFIKDIRVIAYE